MENNNVEPASNAKQEIAVKLDRQFSLKQVVIGTAILVGVFVIMGFILTSWIRDRTPTFDNRAETDSAMLEATVRRVAKLATMSIRYTEVMVHEDQNTIGLFGRAFGIPGTSRFLVARWQGDKLMGIDASDISVEIVEHENHRDVVVSLPDTRILSHAIDFESIEVMNEGTGLFTSFATDDLTSFIADMQEEIETRASTLQLLHNTREATEEALYELLRLALRDGEYTISFIWR